tara:strand:+ start:322 stop:765 length:444 start_codon:yes stop_codon:yes gene_type:complete
MIIEGNIQSHGAVIKEGKKPYNQIELNGKKFNHFEDELVLQFPAGTKVRVTTEADGKYEKLISVESMDGLTPTPTPTQTQTTETTTPNLSAVNTVMNITDKPNSYTWGPVDRRHKVYYNTVPELLELMEELKIVDGELEIKPEDFGK